MNNQPQLRPTPDLSLIHQELQELYGTEYPEGAPHLFERLLPKLPEYIRALVRRKLDLIVREETRGEHLEGIPCLLDRLLSPLPTSIQEFVRGKLTFLLKPEIERVESYVDLSDGDKEALSIFLNPQVLRAHFDVGRDFALSNDTHEITHFETLPPIIAHELITVAASKNPKPLERIGCVFFDVDATKTIVDGTSHAHAGKYLEHLAEFLCNLPPTIREWLTERGLKSEAYAYAGDEFIVMVHSEEQPLTKSILDSFAKMVQEAIAVDNKLASCVSFDDPKFIMEFDDWSDEDRKAYLEDPDRMSERLKASRATLHPDGFRPSVSFGSATLLRALQEALSPDTEESKTLEELGVNAFRLMVARADARLKKDKREFRENMTDPLWKAFFLRNAENRRLLSEVEQARIENRRLIRELAESQAENGRMAKAAEHQASIIRRLTEELAEARDGTVA